MKDPLDDMHIDEASERYLTLLAARSMAARSSRPKERIYTMFGVTAEEVDRIEEYRQAANAARNVRWNHSSLQ